MLDSNNKHWLTISTVCCSYSTMKVYDSQYMKMPQSTIKQVCSLFVSSEPSIIMQFEPSDHYLNGNDCGLFTLALCAETDPQGFDQKAVCQHLLRCFTQGHVKPFPCKGIIQAAVGKTYQILIYCNCHTHEAGSMMECKRCGEWYHQECFRLPKHVWKKGCIQWVCRYCSQH